MIGTYSTFIGTINKCVNGPEQTCPYILLLDVSYAADGKVFRDHVWIKWAKRLDKYSFGDTIEFTAREEKYLCSTGKQTGLKHVRNIRLVKEQ